MALYMNLGFQKKKKKKTPLEWSLRDCGASFIVHESRRFLYDGAKKVDGLVFLGFVGPGLKVFSLVGPMNFYGARESMRAAAGQTNGR